MAISFDLNFTRQALLNVAAQLLGMDTEEKVTTSTLGSFIGSIGSTEARNRVNREMESDGVRFVAKLDSKTTDICRSLNGKEWPVDSPKMKVPPLHWNCRSQLVNFGGLIK